MSKSFRTSKSNKVIVGELTRLLSLGFENHIARIAIIYSIKKWEKSVDIILRDSKGKEYSSQILFGEYDDVYKVCLLYTSPSPRDRQKSRMPSSA